MRISDWSSDVCSSDLAPPRRATATWTSSCGPPALWATARSPTRTCVDRKSVVLGKSVSVRVDLGGRRIIKKKIIQKRIDRYVRKTYSKDTLHQDKHEHNISSCTRYIHKSNTET